MAIISPVRAGAGIAVPGLLPVSRVAQPDLQHGPEEILDVRYYQDFLAYSRKKIPLSFEQMIRQIMFHTEIEVMLKTLGLAFVPRVVTVGTTPTLIIERSKFPRGYIFINPAEVSGDDPLITFFPSANRAVSVDSPAFNVQAVDTIRFFLDVTAAVGSDLRIDIQTRDPLTGKFATALSSIFGGTPAVASMTVGTYYSAVGPTGIDHTVRARAAMTIGNATFSLSGWVKGNITQYTGTTVFIGPRDVNTTIGYPLLPAQKEAFWLLDNVELFAIVPRDTVDLKIIQLQ